MRDDNKTEPIRPPKTVEEGIARYFPGPGRAREAEAYRFGWEDAERVAEDRCG